MGEGEKCGGVCISAEATEAINYYDIQPQLSCAVFFLYFITASRSLLIFTEFKEKERKKAPT